MPRSLSATLQAAANAQETTEVFLMLLTIDHADLAAPTRIVNNTKAIISNGNTFTAYPFEISLPDDDPERPPEVTVAIDNVAQDIIQALRQVSSPLSFDLEVVLASDPNTVEIGPLKLEMTSADWDAGVIRGRLAYPELLDESYPADTYNPALYPGLFK
ncbi:MAG: DUF1833 family protein [Kiloniellales bacterium]